MNSKEIISRMTETTKDKLVVLKEIYVGLKSEKFVSLEKVSGDDYAERLNEMHDLKDALHNKSLLLDIEFINLYNLFLEVEGIKNICDTETDHFPEMKELKSIVEVADSMKKEVAYLEDEIASLRANKSDFISGKPVGKVKTGRAISAYKKINKTSK